MIVVCNAIALTLADEKSTLSRRGGMEPLFNPTTVIEELGWVSRRECCG